MAKLNSRKFSMESFKEAPTWLGTFLSQLNSFITEVYSSYQNQLTIEDNLYQEIKEVRLVNETTNLPLVIKTKFNKMPLCVQVIYCVATDNSTPSVQPWLTWTFNNQLLSILNITGLTASKTYTFRFLIIYG